MNSRRNKGQSGLAIVVLLIAIIVVAYFAVPAFQTWVKNMWGQISNLTGQSAVGLIVTYEDGTTREFRNSLPLTIVDPSSGLTVTKITIEMDVALSYNGTMQSYSGSSSLNIHLKNTATNQIIKTLYVKPLSFSGTTLPKGVLTKVWTLDITAAEIQNAYTGWTNGQEYFLFIEPNDITFNVIFTDGKSDSKTVVDPQTINWRMRYSSYGINSIVITFLNTPS